MFGVTLVPSAFELLTQNSASPNGSTAWAHMNAQQQGGGGHGDVYVDQGITIYEWEESVSALSFDQLDLTVIDHISIAEIVDSKTNIEVIMQEGEIYAE